MSQFDNVSVVKKANVYFDGKCVSHSVVMADGVKKTVGVILPASLTFNTGAPEIMEGVGGSCRVRLKDEADWKTDNLHETLNKALVEEGGYKPRLAFGPVRVAMSGRRVSPPLFESMEIVGKPVSLARLKGLREHL